MEAAKNCFSQKGPDPEPRVAQSLVPKAGEVLLSAAVRLQDRGDLDDVGPILLVQSAL